MREVKHLTTGTAKDRMNVAPIWSRGRQVHRLHAGAGQGHGLEHVSWRKSRSAQSTLLTPHEGEKLLTRPTTFRPTASTLLITSNAGNGYDNAGLLDIATKKIHWLTQDKWEIPGDSFSPDGKSLTYTANVDGNIDIYSVRCRRRKSARPAAAQGAELAVRQARLRSLATARACFITHTGPTAPGDLWVYTLADGKSHQLTHSLVGGVRSEDMVEPHLVHYPSKDGKWTISAFVYVPYNLPRNGQHPAIVYVHGGPTAQTMNSFNRFVQYMVNQGYIVIAPNYRGSTGYGKEFQQANLFDMGGGDLQDVLAAADWIKQTGYVDPKKLILMGGSYGGYLTMMGVTKAPELWAAGVPIVPFVNWFTEIQNEDPGAAAVATWPPWAIRRRTKRSTKTVRRSISSTRSKRRSICWPAATIRAARRPKRSRWSMRSRSAAAWSNTRSTKTKATALREWKIRLTPTSAWPTS